MAISAFILIIIFRNEIRIVLQTRNWKELIWGMPRKETNTPVELIVSSVDELTRMKSGALIVFPGKDDPESIIQSGLSWYGLISKEMILSIFWKNNPVHDGAVIIRGNKIMKVGAILPLTLRETLPAQCNGTRHRAALGLAENTDALVIVVSEETGKVSVAKNSKLIQISDDLELARRLHTHLGITPEKSNSLKRERLRLCIAALLSFLFITGIWHSFTRNNDTLISKKFPVQVDWSGKLPENLILESVFLKPQKTTIKGPGQILESISTIYTENVSLDDIKQTGTVTVNLALNQESLIIDHGNNDKISVSYVVRNRY
jgi:uncharacterized protein (TIGR00159 family)